MQTFITVSLHVCANKRLYDSIDTRHLLMHIQQHSFWSRDQSRQEPKLVEWSEIVKFSYQLTQVQRQIWLSTRFKDVGSKLLNLAGSVRKIFQD